MNKKAGERILGTSDRQWQGRRNCSGDPFIFESISTYVYVYMTYCCKKKKNSCVEINKRIKARASGTITTMIIAKRLIRKKLA